MSQTTSLDTYKESSVSCSGIMIIVEENTQDLKLFRPPETFICYTKTGLLSYGQGPGWENSGP